jgi:hypothetical protein
MLSRLTHALNTIGAFGMGWLAFAFDEVLGDAFASGLCFAGLVVLLWLGDNRAILSQED